MNTQSFELWLEDHFITYNSEIPKCEFETDFNKYMDNLTVDEVVEMAKLYGVYMFRAGTEEINRGAIKEII